MERTIKGKPHVGVFDTTIDWSLKKHGSVPGRIVQEKI